MYELKILHVPLIGNESKRLKFQEILVVKKFLDVFPDNFSGLSPNRDVKFTIEL